MKFNDIEIPGDDQQNEAKKTSILFLLVAGTCLFFLITFVLFYLYNQGKFDHWLKEPGVVDVDEKLLSETEVNEKRQSFSIERPDPAIEPANEESVSVGDLRDETTLQTKSSIPGQPIFETDPEDPTRKIAEVDAGLPVSPEITGTVGFAPEAVDNSEAKVFVLPPAEIEEVPGVVVGEIQVDSPFTANNIVMATVEGVVVEFDELNQALVMVVDGVMTKVYLAENVEYLIDGSSMSSSYIDLYDIIAVTGRMVEGEAEMEAEKVEIVGVYDPSPY